MGTLIRIDPVDASAVAAAGARAAACLAAGGVAVLPAEGLYGLHASLSAPAGVARLRALKRDGLGRPYILLVADRAMALALIDASAPATVAAERWWGQAWPGAVTFVVPAGPRVPADLQRAGFVALRCPGSEFLRDVAQRLRAPLLSTSANTSGGRPPARVEEIEPELREACDLVIDGGPLSGQGSTVVRVEADGTLATLRPGAWIAPGN
jgi:L-threonylcarbamoyladenylate synthase